MRLRDSGIVHLAHHVSVTVLTTVSAGLASAIIAGTAHAQSSTGRALVPGGAAGVTAFVNVGVVPMDRERVLADQTVLVAGGRIIALGPSTKVKVPATATRIDGRGKYLMPGLGNCRVRNDAPTQGTAADTARVLEHGLLMQLAAGVTTARVTEWASEYGPHFLRLRARAEAGELLIPRIYTSGRLWTRLEKREGRRPGWLMGDMFGDADHQARTRPEEVAAQVAAYKAQGYDFISYTDELDLSTPEGQATWDSLAAAARRAKLPIAWRGHDYKGWLLRHVQDVWSIDGLEAYVPYFLLDEPDSNPQVAARRAELVTAMQRAGVWSCPSVFNFTDPMRTTRASLALDTAPKAFVQWYGAAQWTTRKRLALRRWGLIKAFQDAGVGVLYGSIRVFPAYTQGELLSLAAPGLTPYQVLTAATRNLAAALGTLDSAGTVAVGKRADLLLLDHNPLERARYEVDGEWTRPVETYGLHPVGVMVGGRWTLIADLERRLSELGETARRVP